MLKIALALGAMFLAATPAAAQKMPLPTFLDKATSLEKQGPLALMRMNEINALQTEMKGAGAVLKAERDTAAKNKRKAAFCPPPGQNSLAMSSTELLGELRAIPAARARRMTTTDGLRTILITRYPCRA